MLKEISVKELEINPFSMIGDEWLLISAGNKDKSNMMTASWGGMGVLWGKNVVTIYIRPSRYTIEFVEKEEYFSLCFLGKDKVTHKITGSKSGRDIDKIKATGLTPMFDESAVYYKEAEVVFICKKLYQAPMEKKNFVSKEIDKFYNENDYHKVFIGEIIKVLKEPKRK